jgi:hypothetical protein
LSKANYWHNNFKNGKQERSFGVRTIREYDPGLGGDRHPKKWDSANDGVKFGVIAVISCDVKNGEILYQEMGERKTKAGAQFSTAVGAAIGILSGGIGCLGY